MARRVCRSQATRASSPAVVRGGRCTTARPPDCDAGKECQCPHHTQDDQRIKTSLVLGDGRNHQLAHAHLWFDSAGAKMAYGGGSNLYHTHALSTPQKCVLSPKRSTFHTAFCRQSLLGKDLCFSCVRLLAALTTRLNYPEPSLPASSSQCSHSIHHHEGLHHNALALDIQSYSAAVKCDSQPLNPAPSLQNSRSLFPQHMGIEANHYCWYQ